MQDDSVNLKFHLMAERFLENHACKYSLIQIKYVRYK